MELRAAAFTPSMLWRPNYFPTSSSRPAVWPGLLQGKKGEGSVYAALAKVVPYDSREEEARRDGQYMYYPSGACRLVLQHLHQPVGNSGQRIKRPAGGQPEHSAGMSRLHGAAG